MKFKDIDKQWFNELKDYVHDYIIDDYVRERIINERIETSNEIL